MALTAGRFWIRRCSLEALQGELRVALGGLGWFWVERHQAPFSLRQYVYFRVAADLRGNIEKRIAWKNEILSLWFKSSRAVVEVQPLGTIHPHSDNLVISVLRRLSMPLPPLNVDTQARRQVESEVTDRFERALERGFTVIFDSERSQPEFAMGELPAGTVPQRPFENAGDWLVNENVLVAPGGVHVFGPFEASQALELDARVTRGPGLTFGAVCADDVERAFAAVDQGDASQIPATEIVEQGTISGKGLHSVSIRRARCPRYVVISGIGDAVGESAIRIALP